MPIDNFLVIDQRQEHAIQNMEFL